MHLFEAGRVESRAVPERRADDRVVDRREVIEHVELRRHQVHAVIGAPQQANRGRHAVAGQRAPSPAPARGTPASATAPSPGGRSETGARHGGRLRRASSAATAVRRSAGSARNRSAPFPGRIGFVLSSLIGLIGCHRPARLDPGRDGLTNGSRRLARQPVRSSRFSRISEPPCPSAIWRQSTRPIPEPPGFVVKNGTNRLPVFDSPGPSSSTHNSIAAGETPGSRCQPTRTLPPVSRTASMALRSRLISSCSS